MKLLITLAALSAVALGKPGYSAGYKSGWNSGYGSSGSYGGYHGPSAPLAHDGRVIETPEVAHAKAAHLAAHAEAAAKASWGPSEEENHGYYSGQSHGYAVPAAFSNNVAHYGHGYHGPPAPLDHEGRVVDTPDVAHLKAAHFAAHAEAAAKAPHYGGGYGSGFEGYNHGGSSSVGYGYHGPAAPLAHDGRVIDTPEVAHAKAAHLAAHHSAANSVAHGPSYYQGAGYAHGSAPSYYNKW